MDEEIIMPDLSEHRQEAPKKPIEDRRTGSMVTSIVMFCVGILFFAVTLFYVFSILTNQDKTGAAISFIVFIFTLGWLTYIPTVILSIIGVCMGASGVKSTKKANKVTSIIFLILNSILLAGIVIIGLVLIMFPSILNSQNA